ncbi:MAG: hypothetical protein WC679_00540 [Bacteroidales bacterium]|jgi:hypothetical protein
MKNFNEFLTEEVAVVPMTAEEIKVIWAKVFPNSFLSIGKGALGGGLYATGYLAKDKSEFSNGISNNDPLRYRFNIDNGVDYEEDGASLLQNPEKGSFMAFSSVKLRKKNIKKIDAKKLEKRFQEVKAFVKANVGNMPDYSELFDINSKV